MQVTAHHMALCRQGRWRRSNHPAAQPESLFPADLRADGIGPPGVNVVAHCPILAEPQML